MLTRGVAKILDTFLKLKDTPSSYAGQAGKVVKVKGTEDGVEFAVDADTTDHGTLTGLADDDHTQYHNDARGDARYAPMAKGVTNGDAHDHNGGDGAQIDHVNLASKGTNTHPQIDTHISSSHVNSFNGRTGTVSPATNDYTWAQVNKATSNIADITTRSHASLTDIGSNTHPQLDTHLASTANPHTTTLEQARFAGSTLAGDVNFAKYKAIAMCCDNGGTLPSSPSLGQWFLHTPTGRKILMQYDGSNWIPIMSMGTMTIYVDGTSGTDSPDKGFGSGSDAFKTITYAINAVPGLVSGNVSVNVSEGTYNEYVYVLGKSFTVWASINITGAKTELTTGTVQSAVKGGSAHGSITVSGTPFASDFTTNVNADSLLGAYVVKVANTSGFAVGDEILIGSGTAREESFLVVSKTASQLTINGVLGYNHTAADADTVEKMKYSGCFLEMTSGADNGNIYLIDFNRSSYLQAAGAFMNTVSAGDTFRIFKPGTKISGTSAYQMRTDSGQVNVYWYNCEFYTTSTFAVTSLQLSKLSIINSWITGGQLFCATDSYLGAKTCRIYNPGNTTGIQSRGDCWLYNGTKVVARDVTAYHTDVLNGGLLTVRNGSIFQGGRYGVRGRNAAFIDIAGSNSLGWNKARNCAWAGIRAEVNSSVSGTALVAYEGNALDESADGATFGYID